MGGAFRMGAESCRWISVQTFALGTTVLKV